MIKKTISMMIMVAVVFGTMLTVSAQDNNKSYKMWEDMMFTPDNAHLKVLSENIRKHNQKYHKSGVYKATVYNIVTGPNAGKII